MYYVSTRNKAIRVLAHEAILQGLAPDGGLFVPERFPVLSKEDLEQLCAYDFEERAVFILSLYLDEFSRDEISSFAANAYSPSKFPPGRGESEVAHTRQAPVVKVGNGYFLELWHGPTCAFKDMALQMLPWLLKASLEKSEPGTNVLILTATSGDTGKAALEGFKDVGRTKIMVFYPAQGVSNIQALQMNSQAGGNVYVQAVKGNFDDTQTGVKAIFTNSRLIAELEESGWKMSSANSINWGRLVPQIVYYVSAYCDLVSGGEISLGSPVNFCVPTGNFGNILAAYYAKKMGIPINKLICASNDNNILTDFIRGGNYDTKREFYCTISPSMDILISSNLERMLFDILGGDDAEIRGYMSDLAVSGAYRIPGRVMNELRSIMWADFSTESETRESIRQIWSGHRYLIDPHTAVAVNVAGKYQASTGDGTPTIIVSTANPYKFCEAVLDAIGASSCSDRGTNNGTELIDLLHKTTGVPVPEPIGMLRNATVRFSGEITKDEMPACVTEFAHKS
jgi:threonine synthase